MLTILGVSNLSFGINQHARSVLNSVFLYHAVAAGLDAAIINPAHVTPYAEIDAEQREMMEDLVNKRPDALARVIQFYEAFTPEEARRRPTRRRGSRPTRGSTTRFCTARRTGCPRWWTWR